MRDYILDAAVTLRRNYADLPFDAITNEETARRVNERAMVALERSGESYAYLLAADLEQERAEELTVRRLLSSDAKGSVGGAAYLRMDERACVETAGEDHLLISAYDDTGDLNGCFRVCCGIAEVLADTGRMARSEQFGFLTACPCDAGTGLRASFMLHLPMTALIRQISAAVKLVAKEGMHLQGLGGGFCRLENRVTLGQEESALLQKTADSAQKLCTLERTLRWRARERKDLNVADKAWRAYATARYALRMSKNEALQLWSGMTLGLSALEMPYSQENLDSLWHIAHMPQGKLMQDSTLQPDVERARRVRALFNGGD